MLHAQDLYRESVQKLAESGFQEAKSLVYLLLEEGFGIDKTDIVLNKAVDIEHSLFHKALDRLLKHEPLQQVLGFAYFMNRKFEVNRHVLIPRPETEGLIYWAKDLRLKAPRILDIGTGSGCIAISLALECPGSRVTALDISKRALEIADKNARFHNVEMGFAEHDFLQSTFAGTYDLVVSNPPYIRESEKAEMEHNVLGFEPHLALFVPDESPLIFYNALADFGLKQDAENVYVLVEINSRLGQETQKLFKEKGYGEVALKQDFFGKDRFVLAKKSKP